MYTCEKCAKVFKQKGHYSKHLKRVRPCVTAPVADDKLCRPFLKWVGGKSQIITDVLALFPKEMTNYHEPFLGGGSVLLAVLSEKAAGRLTIHGQVYASDLNANLIALYKNIQSKVDALIEALTAIVNEFKRCTAAGEVNRSPKTLEEALTSPESYYFWTRALFNTLADRESVRASAMLLFLNKTCFRGLYREGPRGFNVPFGNYKNPSIFDEEHLRSVSALIKDVVFTCRSYRDSLGVALSGDFVYLDPPYAPENEKSFVGYTADGFNLEAHEDLFKMCNAQLLKGVKMLMSNADVKLVRDAFPSSQFTTKIISCRRAINSKEPSARVNEVLITNRESVDL